MHFGGRGVGDLSDSEFACWFLNVPPTVKGIDVFAWTNLCGATQVNLGHRVA